MMEGLGRNDNLGPRAIRSAAILVEAVAVLGVPILLTGQYPAALGRRVPEIRRALKGTPHGLVDRPASSQSVAAPS